jgi:hypothetical protein
MQSCSATIYLWASFEFWTSTDCVCFADQWQHARRLPLVCRLPDLVPELLLATTPTCYSRPPAVSLGCNCWPSHQPPTAFEASGSAAAGLAMASSASCLVVGLSRTRFRLSTASSTPAAMPQLSGELLGFPYPFSTCFVHRAAVLLCSDFLRCGL